MFRVLRILLLVCIICGVFSLVVFYLYTSRHDGRLFSLLTSSTSRTKKENIQKKLTEEVSLKNNIVSGLPSLKPILTQTSSRNRGTDVVDELIKNSLESNTNRGHSDGDEIKPPVTEKVNTIEPKALKTITSQSFSTVTEIPTTVLKIPTEKTPINTDPPPLTNTEEGEDEMEFCPEKPQSLTGPLFVNQNVPKIEDVAKHFSDEYGGWVRKGGSWRPPHCKSKVKMALIIPFRKRDEQLAIFVRHMHPMLKRQEVDYRVIVVEQTGNTPFNRAILFNIGYKEALKLDNYNCFIFHDVDLIPEDDRNLYTCPTSPRHMSVAVDKFNYRLPYASIFGGAGALSKEHFEEINGFSNMFWGWGGEDDDLYQRVVSKGHHLSRPSLQIGRYKMVRIHHHQSSEADPNRHALLQNTVIRMARDGLNSLKYKLINVEERHLYTLVQIHADKSLLQ